jgi:hypothetical protein
MAILLPGASLRSPAHKNLLKYHYITAGEKSISPA